MIRPFTPKDYLALARIASAAAPDYPSSVEEMEFYDARRDAKCRQGRWQVERDGHVAGFGSSLTSPSSGDARGRSWAKLYMVRCSSPWRSSTRFPSAPRYGRIRNGPSDSCKTGVRREHRRQGIALALKLKTIAWAKRIGYSQIQTWNEANNQGMLGINERLGFVRQPA